MSAAQTIRRLGFRKWYERELLRGHVNLVLLLLSTLALLASVEVLGRSMPAADRLLVVVGAAASAAIGYLALRRYLRLLNHAEFVADQAVCRRCDTYAKWDLMGEVDAGSHLDVRCRKCAHHWRIEL